MHPSYLLACGLAVDFIYVVYMVTHWIYVLTLRLPALLTAALSAVMEC